MSAHPSATPGNEERGLRVRGVSHAYGRFVAAREIDLEVGPGEVHCLLGPSGSGKSTLLRLVAGLETLQEGEIRLAGRSVAAPGLHVKPEHRAIGFVFQDYALFPHLDAWHNVAFGMPRGPARERRAAAEALLAQVGLEASSEAMPHTLSGGQQQRVALARALARRPQVMLLDEPFSGLDAQLREDVRRSTLEVLRNAEVATLMVTHDPREALVAGDLVSVIRGGRVVQTGTPGEVYGRSVSRRVAEVFGPINAFEGIVAEGRVETPWGTFEAPGLDPGQDVEVLVRPEAVTLVLPGSTADSTPLDSARLDSTRDLVATVVEVVPEGGLCRTAVQHPLGDTVPLLTSRDLAHRAPAAGAKVSVVLADHAAWVVPRD